MKKSVSLFVFAVMAVSAFSQNTIAGKWKLVAMEDAEEGKKDVSDSAFFYKQFWEGVTEEYKKEGKQISEADSVLLKASAKQSFYEMNNYFIQFNANKTYKGSMGKQATSGTYIYNAATKKLSKKEKGSTKYKVSKVTFEDGQMVVEVTDENLLLYFDRVK